jgi:hypothetical protein
MIAETTEINSNTKLLLITMKPGYDFDDAARIHEPLRVALDRAGCKKVEIMFVVGAEVKAVNDTTAEQS